MIPLSYYTSLWQKMLFDCLSSVCPMLLSKGQLHSVTQKVITRQYRTKEELNNLNMCVGLSTSRHTFIPHGRTPSFRVYTCCRITIKLFFSKQSCSIA